MRNEKEKDMNITRINTEYASVKNIWKHRKRERERERDKDIEERVLSFVTPMRLLMHSWSSKVLLNIRK